MVKKPKTESISTAKEKSQMTGESAILFYLGYALGMVLATCLPAAMASASSSTDLLNIAQGAIPVSVEGRAKELSVGMSRHEACCQTINKITQLLLVYMKEPSKSLKSFMVCCGQPE